MNEAVTFKDCMSNRENCKKEVHDRIDRLTYFVMGNIILTILTLIKP